MTLIPDRLFASCRPDPAPGGRELYVPSHPGWEIRHVAGAAEFRQSWPAAERADDLWLRPATLARLATAPQGLATTGLELTHSVRGRRILLSLQDMHFRARQQLGDGVKGDTSRLDFRRRSLRLLAPRVYVIGQLLTSGNYATDGLGELPPAEAAGLVAAVGKYLLTTTPGVSAVLLKDLWTADHPAVATARGQQYLPLPSEPVMRLDLRPFASQAEYLSALTSKYRVRYRRARAKVHGLTVRPLPLGEVERRLDRIYALYGLTRGTADVNLTELTPSYFRWLAEVGRMTGYFDGERLIGFTSLLPNGPVWQAHFLGMEAAYKSSHHLYHNMLCDLLEESLAGGARELDLGRTASEIKSSLGARPVAYANLVHVRSPVLRRILPAFVPAFFRQADWQPRHPFRG